MKFKMIAFSLLDGTTKLNTDASLLHSSEKQSL